MKTAPIVPTTLNGDQLAALDIMQSVALEGLSADDQTTMEGVADVIAGRTLDEDQSRQFFKDLRTEIQNRGR
jgi:hypothetical protein